MVQVQSFTNFTRKLLDISDDGYIMLINAIFNRPLTICYHCGDKACVHFRKKTRIKREKSEFPMIHYHKVHVCVNMRLNGKHFHFIKCLGSGTSFSVLSFHIYSVNTGYYF